MQLSRLASLLGATLPKAHSSSTQDTSDPNVIGISHRADWLQTGQVFAAIRGARFDGHQFAQQAKDAGAVALIGEGWTLDKPCPLPYLQVANVRQALGAAAAVLSNQPSEQMQVVGITGTDGKTTTSWFTRQLLRSSGIATGLLSTIGYELPDGQLRQFPAHFTTPEAPQLQQTLWEMKQAGAQAVVLEVSSHALALERVFGIDWNVGVWTQLTSEHLDFHGTVENYFAEKRKLIERAPFAVLNADDPHYQQLRQLGPHHSYSIDEKSAEAQAEWQASDICENSSGMSFLLTCPLGEATMHLPMIGRFNISNALAALAAAAHLGATLPQLKQGLANCGGVLGRMQLVSISNIPSSSTDEINKQTMAPRVVVDFAHTPDSLDKALATLRPSTSGKLWVVIGSAGGLRDPSKRAPLGKSAIRGADVSIFTEEDHRDTPLAEILQAMQQGAEAEGGILEQDFWLIPERRAAIRFAIANAKPQDTVLLAGKGAEHTLERTDEVLEWDEVSEAKQALELLLI